METNPVDLGSAAKPEPVETKTEDIADVAADIVKETKPKKAKAPKAEKKAKAPKAEKVAKAAKVVKAPKAEKTKKVTRESKAGHKAQGQVSMGCWKALMAYSKAEELKPAEIVRIAVEKLLKYKDE